MPAGRHRHCIPYAAGKCNLFSLLGDDESCSVGIIAGLSDGENWGKKFALSIRVRAGFSLGGVLNEKMPCIENFIVNSKLFGLDKLKSDSIHCSPCNSFRPRKALYFNSKKNII